MWGKQAEYAWAMPSTPASGRREDSGSAWSSLTLHPLSAAPNPNTPVFGTAVPSLGPGVLEGPREQGQGGIKSPEHGV